MAKQPETQPAAVLENPNPAPPPPRESMAGSVLVDETSPVTTSIVSGADVGTPAPVLLENPNPAPPPPRESMAGSVLVEDASAADESAAAQPARPTAPAAVRTLPRRPRLRASFHYDHADQLQLELTLMDERRGLIHRHNVQPQEGGALARIFEALIAVAVQAGAFAGVFGETRKAPNDEQQQRALTK